ncbi:hypothetical protein OEZ85_012755 [Tetradesmus obliquus]|uniref:Ig-like domain-containing protein n=1 Tax=Tetradesmus obliquus TaxID=3088 RepID=A0ABY8U8Q8_TETOB|nr:hypothetical protein OEZ85_012755 [Tetradesmus obliquus]
MGLTNVPTEVANLLNVEQPALAYVPKTAGFVDEDGRSLGPGTTLSARVSCPVLNIPAAATTLVFAALDGKPPQSVTLTWSSPFSPVKNVMVNNMQMTLKPGSTLVSAVQSKRSPCCGTSSK